MSTAAGRVVVALEESTYLTIVCPLVRFPDFVRVFAASVGAALEGLDIPIGLIQSEVSGIVEGASFVRNDNRSLLGSVNDVAFHATVLLEDARRNDPAAFESSAARTERNAACAQRAGISVTGRPLAVVASVDRSLSHAV